MPSHKAVLRNRISCRQEGLQEVYDSIAAVTVYTKQLLLQNSLDGLENVTTPDDKA